MRRIESKAKAPMSFKARAVFIAIALAFAITMAGTTLPTPLYPQYQHRLGFSELMIIVIYAIYASGVLSALIVTGRWSDQIGRRPVLALGLGCSGLSACFFLWGGTLAPLLIGRVLSGFSSGIFTGTATVAVIELAPPAWSGLSTVVATGANMGGLGCGALLAGLCAQYLPWPLHLCFGIDLTLVLMAGVAVGLASEPVKQSKRSKHPFLIPSVPPCLLFTSHIENMM